MSVKLDALAAAEAATAETNRVAYYIAVLAVAGRLPDAHDVRRFETLQAEETAAWSAYHATLTTL